MRNAQATSDQASHRRTKTHRAWMARQGIEFTEIALPVFKIDD